nr:hypothetical protein CFP56_61636 [Quercus suber]
MNADDKPYGPWLGLHCLETTTGLGTISRQHREVQKNVDLYVQAATRSNWYLRSAVKETHPQTTAVKDNEKGRADVGVVGAVTEVEIPRIPHAQQGCQFEEQLKEIDAVIFGDMAHITNHHHAEQSTKHNEKCGKRRTRSPLKDISGSVENVKRNKVEGDVMALSKLMA